MQDVLDIADDVSLRFRGDSGDEVNITGENVTRGTDQVIDSLTFDHYTGRCHRHGFVVQVGLDYNGSEVVAQL